MNVSESVKVKVKSTSTLSLPVLLNENTPLERLERRLRAFLKNPEWIYDTLKLINKIIENKTSFSTFDNWALERLDLIVKIENDEVHLIDRYNESVTKEMLMILNERVLDMTTGYAKKLIKSPELHPMEYLFKRTLRRSQKRKLNDEEVNILRDAYLKLQDNKVVNLKGEEVKLPKFNFFTLLIA